MTTLTGVLRDSGGNPINGVLWLELSQAGLFSPGSILVTPLVPSVFTLAAGSISGPGAGPYSVYGNDGITPSTTWYRLTAFNEYGGQILRWNVLITGATVDLGALVTAPTGTWIAGASSVHNSLSGRGDADAHPGTAVSVTPAGGISAVTVQAALEELDAEKITQDGTARTGVRKTGTLIGARRNINLLEGANVTLTVVDQPGSEAVDVTVAAAGGGGGATLADGDYGDVTASAGGTVLTVDPKSISYAKIQDVSTTNRLLGRATAGAGVIEEITLTAAGRALLDDAAASDQRATLGLGTIATQAASAVAITGGTVKAALTDAGGQVFNVKAPAFGAVGDGTTDDTTAIGNAITAAAAISPRGVVFFPPGTYKTYGGYDLNGLSGLKIIGSGRGSTVIDINHATNDLFSVAATFTTNFALIGFTLTSVTVTRTAGWVFRVNNAYNGTGSLIGSTFRDLEMTKQFNGIGVQKFAFVWVENVLGHQWAGAGVGLRFGQASTGGYNQGAGGGFDKVEIYGSDGVRGAGNPVLAQPLVVEDCEGISLSNSAFGAGLTNSAKFATNDSSGGAHALSNLFITNCSFDTTRNGHAVHITGAGDIARLKFNNCWFAGAGRASGGSATANGLRVDCRIAYSSEFTGCNFYLTQGAGAYIAPSGGAADLIISGSRFYQNGLTDTAANADGIYIATTAGSDAPIISGCRQVSVGAVNGKGIRTSAGANKLVISGSRFADGNTYGVAPAGDTGNVYT